MLSMHCEMSLIHACLSCTVDAIRWMDWRPPHFWSMMILKSRLPFVDANEAAAVGVVGSGGRVVVAANGAGDSGGGC